MTREIKNLEDATAVLDELNDFLFNFYDDDSYNAMYDELFRTISNASYTVRQVEKFDTKRRETNEMYMLKAVYKRSRHEEKSFYLDFEYVHNINEFKHDYHIYEVTTKRIYETDDNLIKDRVVLKDFDYINKILVFCDFDRSSCCDIETVEEFDELITDLAIDIRFDNVEYHLKQIS